MCRSTSGWNWTPHVRSPSRYACRAAGLAASWTAPCRELEAVVVPLERLHAAREDAEDRVGGARLVHVDVVPTHLCVPGGPDVGARGAGEELSAQADAEEGHAGAEGRLDEGRLAGEPGVLGVGVRVHRAAEDHDRVPRAGVAGRRAAVRGEPAVEPVAALADDALEQAAAAGLGVLVDNGEDAHAADCSPAPARRASARWAAARRRPPPGRPPRRAARGGSARSGAKSSRLLLKSA